MLELNDKTFDEAVKGKRTIVDFWAPWCGPCREMAKPFKAASEAHPELQFVKVNIDEEADGLAQSFNISAIPLFVALDEQGKEVARYEGAMKPASFQRWVGKVFTETEE